MLQCYIFIQIISYIPTDQFRFQKLNYSIRLYFMKSTFLFPATLQIF